MSIFEIVFSVFRSTTLDLFSFPLEEKPRCTSGTATNACTPGVSAISPTTAFFSKIDHDDFGRVREIETIRGRDRSSEYPSRLRRRSGSRLQTGTVHYRALLRQIS